MSESVAAENPKPGKLQKATVGDIVLCVIIPGWGILVGLIALAKREWKRGATMILISAVLIAIFVAWKLS
ncbi:MAG: hypothetical protein ACRDRL_05620, partial [Sciscionella sp.]